MYDDRNIFTKKMIDILKKDIISCIESYYKCDLSDIDLQFSYTKQEFEGDITVVTFPLLRVVKMNPAQLGEELGNYLVEHVKEVKAFNVVKGFLNLVIEDEFYLNFFNKTYLWVSSVEFTY